MKNLKIKPFASAAEVYMRTDGVFEVVPMQVIARDDGGWILRLGETTYWFDEDGTYDGPECRLDKNHHNDDKFIGSLTGQLVECGDARHRGDQIADPYFDPDSPAGRSEQDGWKKE